MATFHRFRNTLARSGTSSSSRVVAAIRSVRKYRKSSRISHQAARIRPWSRYPRSTGQTLRVETEPCASEYFSSSLRRARIAARMSAARMLSTDEATGATLVVGRSTRGTSRSGRQACTFARRLLAATPISCSPRLLTYSTPRTSASIDLVLGQHEGRKVVSALQDISDPGFARDGHAGRDQVCNISIDSALGDLELSRNGFRSDRTPSRRRNLDNEIESIRPSHQHPLGFTADTMLSAGGRYQVVTRNVLEGKEAPHAQALVACSHNRHSGQ